MNIHPRRAAFCMALFLLMGVLAHAGWGGQPRADSKPTPEQAEQLFALKVLPLLKAKCFGCHGDDPQDVKGRFNGRSLQGMLAGGESGQPALVPGDAEASPLYQAVRWDGLEMPPKENDRLNDSQIEWIRRWIAAGAPWPDEQRQRQLSQQQRLQQTTEEGVLVDTSGGLSDQWTYRRYRREDVWAFQPVQRYDPPWDALQDDQRRHPVDAFLRRRLNEKGLTPASGADKLTLIRRATFDLTGLPPASQDIEAYLNDDSAEAFDKLLTRLLASPRYGEQWARHWLDVARYADTAGYANDFERPHAWRYRDYVVRSFNQDKPYDQFIVEQIAGDQLDPSRPEYLIATGFLRMGPWEHTGMSVEAVTRQLFLDDVTNAVGQTFLAINMTCCKCHDHKFDPLPTRDYYRLQAVFAPTQFGDRPVAFEPFENTSGFQEGKTRVTQLLGQAQRYLGQLKEKKDKAMADLLAEHGVASIQELPVGQGNLAFYGLTDLEKSLEKITRKRVAYYQRELARYEPYVFSVYDGPFLGYKGVQNKAILHMPPPHQQQGEAQPVHILQGGALDSPGPQVTPGVLSAMAGSNDTLRATAWNTIPRGNRGRRLALARWIASQHNTLTARVMVNRIWQYHFGKGLVATPNAFGKMGGKPTHPELLDWLAAWFIDHGWSIKKLHRLIMTSRAYQRASQHPQQPLVAQADPKGQLLAFFPPRRLSAEEIRDSLLAITGELNYEMGGPGVYPEINWEVALQPRQIMGTVAPAYQPSRTPRQRNRRTIYTFRYRTLSDPMLEVFNRPGTEFSCAKRDETTVTPQVFALLNGQYVHDRAIALAHKLMNEVHDPGQRIVAAFRQVYGRPPTHEEQLMSARHVQQMTVHHQRHPPAKVQVPMSVKRGMVEELTGKLYQFEDQLTLMEDYQPDLKAWQVGPQTRALAELCLVLMNSNEFVYVY